MHNVEFEVGRMSATMTYQEVAEMLADRPDLLATYRRITGIDQAEHLRDELRRFGAHSPECGEEDER